MHGAVSGCKLGTKRFIIVIHKYLCISVLFFWRPKYLHTFWPEVVYFNFSKISVDSFISQTRYCKHRSRSHPLGALSFRFNTGQNSLRELLLNFVLRYFALNGLHFHTAPNVPPLPFSPLNRPWSLQLYYKCSYSSCLRGSINQTTEEIHKLLCSRIIKHPLQCPKHNALVGNKRLNTQTGYWSNTHSLNPIHCTMNR